jgi:PAS domain S-box-containing protein
MAEPLDLDVLLVACDPDAEAIGEALGGTVRDVTTAATWAALEEEAGRRVYGVALVQEALAGREKLLDWLPADPRRVPVLVLLKEGDEEAETAYLRAGAADVIVGLPEAGALRRTLAHARARRAVHVARAWEEERYRLMVEHTFDIVAVLDGFGRYIYASPSIEEKLGYRPEDLLGESAFETVHPEDLPTAMAVFMEAVGQPGTTRQLEYRVLHRGGAVHHFEGVGRAIVGPDGQPYGVINARDVTERRAAEEALRASETRLRHLTESAVDAIVMADDEGCITDWNGSAEALFGYTRDEAVGQSIEIIMPLRYREAHRAGMERYRRTGEPHVLGSTVELYGLRRSGEEFPLELSLTTWTHGDERWYAGIIRDMTERRAADEALRAHEAFLREITSRVPVILFALDAVGVITYVEGKGLTLIETTPEYLVSRSVFEVYAAYPEIIQAVRAALAGEATNLVTTVLGHAFDVHLVPIRARDGRIERVIGVAADVTELKEQQDALARQAEALERSRADLRALAAHLQDVREEERARISREVHDVLGQQLTAVRLGVGWLARRLEGDAEAAARADDTRALIDETIHHVRHIAAELRPGVLDDFGLASAIEWYAERLGARAGLPCQVYVHGDDGAVPPEVATAVFRIFQEALTNAARHACAAAVETRLAVTASVVRLRVCDDGVGMALEQVEGAPTLGLLGMRERARTLGGHVAIESKPGRGTCVSVRVPIPCSSTAPVTQAPTGGAPA